MDASMSMRRQRITGRRVRLGRFDVDRPLAMRVACILAAALSLGLAACGGGDSGTKPLTVSTSPASLGPLLVAADSVSIAEYCLHQVGAKDGKQTPPTAKQRLFELRALQSLRSEAQAHPETTYRGIPLHDQLLKLAKLLGTGRCDPAGAKLLHELARGLR